VKLWTLQAPEVAAQLARGIDYRAGWARVIPSWIGAYEVMTAEMTARGIDCYGVPPAWAWPGWASPKQALYTAELLLRFDQWAHGVVMLRLAVPDDQILCTSYAAWNDFLGPTVNHDGRRQRWISAGCCCPSTTACRRRSRKSWQGGYAGRGR
jgi:hypothetical protein